MKSRSHAFDLLCGICIIRMVMLHLMSFCGFKDLDWWREIMHWSYFFMAFFFFKAGYFNKRIDGNTRDFVIDKTRRLMVPYFAWGAIGCLVYFAFVIFVFSPKHSIVKALSWSHIWETSSFYGNDPLWFLMSFYMMYIVVHLIAKIPALHIGGRAVSWNWIILLFPYLSYWLHEQGDPLPLRLNNVFFAVFLFWLGKLWHKAVERMGNRNTILVSLLLLAGFVALNATFPIRHVMVYNTWEGDFLVLLPTFVCVMCGLSGLLVAVKLSRIPLIGFIGEHSMVYFVSHWVILVFYNFVRSANGRTLRGHCDDAILLTVIVFVICSLLVPYIEKIPLLSGRYQKKKYKLWII